MDDVIQYIGELSESVWVQTLGMELVPSATAHPVCECGSVEGRVRISGQWQGTLVLQCSTVLARRAAQVMFSRESAAESLQDVEDAVGELTNIIGGNLKALVSNVSCSLSLPVVSEAVDFSVRSSHETLLTRQVFASEGEPVIVTLLHADPA
jgi:chemotaxis protein CheX